ncbi:hypothetical protein FACS189421_11090 [Bacteroidia bacterium]|nr:hypothetical protein FACS189421_11090 [Bacteroidia bacterium]
MKAKINAGIVGGRGIVGKEAYGIISQHPNMRVKFVSTGDKETIGKSFGQTYPKFLGTKELRFSDEAELVNLAKKCDVLFLAGKKPENDFRLVPMLRDAVPNVKIITIGAVPFEMG